MDQQAVDPADLPTGGYVYETPYLEMRLRMALTGSARIPSDDAWAKALSRLLAHLDEHPLEAVVEEGTAPAATGPGWPELDHAMAAVRSFDVGDWTNLVMASEHPVAGRFEGRVIAGVAVGEYRMVTILDDPDEDRGPAFALDVDIAFDVGSVGLTVFGTRNGDDYDWHYADLTLRDADARRAAIGKAVAELPKDGPGILAVMEDDLRENLRSRLPDLGTETDGTVVRLEVDDARHAVTGTPDDCACVIAAHVAAGPVVVHAAASTSVYSPAPDSTWANVTAIHAFA